MLVAVAMTLISTCTAVLVLISAEKKRYVVSVEHALCSTYHAAECLQIVIKLCMFLGVCEREREGGGGGGGGGGREAERKERGEEGEVWQSMQ